MISGINSGLSITRLLEYGTTGSTSRTKHAGAKAGTPPPITLTTQEGDTVTFTPKAPQAATYSRPVSGSLASTNLQSNDQFDVTVTGDLSDQEKADIEATLKKMDGARATMDSGDMTSGMAAMQAATAASGTVASVSMPSGPPPGGPPPGGPPPADASSSADSTSDSILSLLESDDDTDTSSLASLLGSFTKKSTDSTGSNSLASALSSSTSTTLEDFLQQVLNNLRAGATTTTGSTVSAS